jgi:hypothetical protein
MVYGLKGTVPRDLTSGFLYGSVYPKPIKALSNVLKIRGDIRGSRCTTGVVGTGGKWKKSSI